MIRRNSNRYEISADPQTRVTAWVSGAIGWISAMAPHLLHHAGLLVGTALVAGAAGTWLFGAIAVIAMVPILVRLHRRTGSKLAPVAMIALMIVMFSASRLLMG
jgi:membrane protein YdbS with pleckstrin-like domain